MTDVRKLYILLCGYEVIRKSGCMRDAPRHIVMTVPICCYLLETARGYVLFDTGLDSESLRDPAKSMVTYCDATFPAPPVVLPEHELMTQLAGLGIGAGDVAQIVLSHAHGDHTGHLADFPNAEILIQKAEHDAAFSEESRKARGFEYISSPRLTWRIVEGDVAVMPGLELLFTPGHRPGHQSALVTLPSGSRKILTGDVVDLLENYERRVLGGAVDDRAALDSLDRIARLAAETGAEIVPLHDPGYVERTSLAPAFHS